MIQILITHLNKKVEDLAKKHFVGKDQVTILYENYGFYYTITQGNETIKRKLDL